jgi:hypothetical protein
MLQVNSSVFFLIIALTLILLYTSCIYYRCKIQTYKKPSKISGTSAAIWSKTNLGPTGHQHIQGNPFLHVCTVPRASANF